MPAARLACGSTTSSLVSCGGLAPVMALAGRCGLTTLLTTKLTLSGTGTANAPAKITALIGGMAAGVDSISDIDLLRHGGTGRVFDEIRAPSTLGTFLRRFTFGHVRQLDAVAARLLARLVAAVPLLPGVEQVTYLDLDDTVRRTYSYAKQGAGRGYTGVKGLNALLAVLSTPLAAPVIAATLLRKGSVNSARGAPRLLAEALVTARRAGAGTARSSMLLRARTRPTTATSSSTPAAGPAQGSRSLRGSPRPWLRRSPASTSRHGRRSATRTRSTTSRSNAGCLTPRLPRSSSPRSPAAATPSTSPPAEPEPWIGQSPNALEQVGTFAAGNEHRGRPDDEGEPAECAEARRPAASSLAASVVGSRAARPYTGPPWPVVPFVGRFLEEEPEA